MKLYHYLAQIDTMKNTYLYCEVIIFEKMLLQSELSRTNNRNEIQSRQSLVLNITPIFEFEIKNHVYKLVSRHT